VELIPWPKEQDNLPVPGTDLVLMDVGGEEDGRPVRHLGRGGQGIVFAARDADDPLLAVKFPLYREWEADPRKLEVFRHEAARGTRIGTSPYLARTFQILNLQGHAGWPPIGFVMEFFPISLAQLVRLCKENGGYRFSAAQVVGWARQLTEALRELHDRHRLVHRDLKPSNIMFRLANKWAGNLESLNDAEAVVTDFGTLAPRDCFACWTVSRREKDPYKHEEFYPLHSGGAPPERQYSDPEMDIHALGQILRVLRRLCAGGDK
jgi:serine/threonine protein kinase